MARFGWLTDIHLNFLEESEFQEFCDTMGSEQLDGLLISGDIGEALSLKHYLTAIARYTGQTVYFVLGNHDFYGGSIHSVRREVRELCQSTKQLVWLNDSGPIGISKNTCVVGHDGWADGINGDFFGSHVVLNDYFLIEELRGRGKRDLFNILGELAKEAVIHFQRVMPLALARFEHVILLTHVPPYYGAAWHEGGPSDKDFAPHFSNRIVGDAISEIMVGHSSKRLTVLCGHTHGAGVYQPVENITVKTGGAEYGRPKLQEIIEL